jgi:hypothetical protein
VSEGGRERGRTGRERFNIYHTLLQCLWKLTRQIPQVADSLNLDQLLLDMHQFMVGYLRMVPVPSPDDIPFRTVKTVLFHLTNTVGAKVSGGRGFGG